MQTRVSVRGKACLRFRWSEGDRSDGSLIECQMASHPFSIIHFVQTLLYTDSRIKLPEQSETVLTLTTALCRLKHFKTRNCSQISVLRSNARFQLRKRVCQHKEVFEVVSESELVCSTFEISNSKSMPEKTLWVEIGLRGR